MKEAEREYWIDKINKMTQYEMARLWRFAPSGHPVFNIENNLHKIFEKRFSDLGGMTSEISKELGWNP